MYGLKGEFRLRRPWQQIQPILKRSLTPPTRVRNTLWHPCATIQTNTRALDAVDIYDAKTSTKD
jgi:hypothetical protein